jgi:UDP-glucose 4-epimerase
MSTTDWRARHGDHFDQARVLVTGGAGFIGSHLTEALLRLGAEVVVLDDLSGGERANVTAAAEAAGRSPHFIEGSIGDPETVAAAITGCRYVFHQAALGSVPRSVEQPERFYQVNATGTWHVLEAARQAGVERVVFAASSSAYGNTATLPKAETMAPEPLSPYAATKAAGEALMRAYAASYPLDTVSLRYFNIFGPRQNANSAYAAVIAAFAKAWLEGETATIYGDGEQSRDFTYIDNAVEANLLAARRPEPLGGTVLNVGCGRRVTVNTLHELTARLTERPDAEPHYAPPRSGDVRHSLADLTRIEHALGYAPLVSLEAGLEQTLAWYRHAWTPHPTPAPEPASG